MQMIVKIYQKTFTSTESSKSAYLEACRWVSNNVMANEDELGEVTWKIKRVKSEDLPTFKLELFAHIESEDTTKNFCHKCKEFHNLFYINDDVNCSRCNYMAFQKQINEKLLVKKHYKRERLGKILNRDK